MENSQKMKQKILVTGSNGLLGQKLTDALVRDRDIALIATSVGGGRHPITKGYYYEPLDVTNREMVKEVIAKHQPDTIINTAAMTDVDACETERETCDRLNVTAVKYLIEAAEENKSHLIHISTDFIFDGAAGPYREEDKPDPLSYYAASKLASEQLFEGRTVKHAILRTCLVFGVTAQMSRSNIVLWARKALGKGEPLRVVNDQFRSPTWAEDLAQACILAAKQKAEGVYHISGKDFMSILELVGRVADFWGYDTSQITAMSSEELNQAAKRPPRTGFVLDKAIRNLGYAPHSFEESLAEIEKQLEQYAPQV